MTRLIAGVLVAGLLGGPITATAQYRQMAPPPVVPVGADYIADVDAARQALLLHSETVDRISAASTKRSWGAVLIFAGLMTATAGGIALAVVDEDSKTPGNFAPIFGLALGELLGGAGLSLSASSDFARITAPPAPAVKPVATR